MPQNTRFVSDPPEQTLGRLTQRVTDEIGEAIVTGNLAQGELLPVEADRVARYGASRSVLREAIKVLNAKGLVTAKPRRGTTVTKQSSWNVFDPDVLRWTLARNFSLELLTQFTEIRIAIEPHASALACDAASEEDIARIGQGFERMVEADRGPDDPLAADISFHLAILDASHNIFLARLKALVETALHFSIRYTGSIARDESEKLGIHEQVYRAIEARDARAARHAALKLLTDALDLMNQGAPPASENGAERPRKAPAGATTTG
ncbi:Putative L-lactate dehydrogenase operon regulatory protein [Tsuneonella dongtanensis]|uniref:Putative L-lactate dehydrogenase operon regulatory protein n=1 Tax=Tsuneonella dongtanensis TaxID=692370 RepID=A0A1B2AAX4_9SPHN|nr:FadR/GntR family transcriptional regulator [Tsuneonella dongtanensis]ANY19323.1 Putative L-lactate dehydrogenase operon regulatory protein [Tsuneonella dongtanensis]